MDELKVYINDKLWSFGEEEFDVDLVLFPEVIEHIAKIDRVLK